jgi:mRNA-degrading endonuclease toxin of MazEF toxin-antitoxin module
MPGFEVWDVVKVPFPYTDRPVREYRPALTVAAGDLAQTRGLLWVLMITSAANRRWPEDVVISNQRTTGLPAPSVVRCAKIATIETAQAQAIGKLPPKDRRRVARQIAASLADARRG